MEKKSQNFLISDDLRNVLTNWFALLLLQSGNYLVPLLLTPYLILVLGIEAFGVLSFVIAVNVFFRTLVSYGFDLTATKMIAEASEDASKVSQITLNVIFSKLFLMATCFIFLCFLVIFFSVFNDNWELLFCFFTLVIADVFFPLWLYQGMQKMRSFTFFKLLSRFVFVGLTILFVKSSDDILLVPIIEGSVAIVISVLCLLLGYKKFSLIIIWPTLKTIKFILHESFHVFLSKVSVLFYTKFNIVLLGVLTTPLMVGYYSVAEKVYMATREMFNPIIQAFFPYLSKKRLQQKCEYNKFIKISFFVILTMLGSCSALLYFLGDHVLYFLLGETNTYTQNLLSILSICLIFAVGRFLSTILVIENRGKVLSKLTLYTVLINLIIVYPLISQYEALGLAFCFLIVQVFHFIMQLSANKHIFSR